MASTSSQTLTIRNLCKREMLKEYSVSRLTLKPMADPTEVRATERRRIARQKSFLRGMIYFNNRRSVADCLIRDISTFGARLIFSDAVTTPDVFDLYIPQKEQTLRSQVMWRNGHEVGVAFPQAFQTEPAPNGSGDLADRVARLEAELAAIKRALKKLKADSGPDPDIP